MELFEAFAKRHSYRGPFRDLPVDRADLRRVVEAGLQAPSGKNGQTTTFVIVDDADMVGRINSMEGANQAMQQAKAFVACIMDKKPEEVYEGYDFQVEDCAAAVENMLLAVTSLGYATVWVDGWIRLDNRADTIGQLVRLPEGKIIRVLLPIGVPAEDRSQPDKKPFEQRAWFNRYESEVS